MRLSQVLYDCEELASFPRWDDVERSVNRRTVRRACVRERDAATATKSKPFLVTHHDKEEQFKALAKKWKRETEILGNLSKIVMHPDYQRIMAMGPDVLPFILRDLSQKPGHWFWALHNLVPIDQDPAEGTTTIEDARQAWLEWGRKNHYL